MTDILRLSEPEQLFPGDLDRAKELYRKLAREHHPDHGGSKDAFQKLNELYDAAVKRIENGTWAGSSILNLDGTKNEYLRSFPFELGHTYICKDSLIFVFDKEHAALAENAAARSGIFTFKDDKMRNEMKRFLPNNVRKFKLKDGRVTLIEEKPKDLVRLRDLLQHSGGSIDPKHAAWIGSSIHNVICYLQWAGMVHQDISLDTFYVSPPDHRGVLLGGWWYSTKAGQALRTVNKRTFNVLPWEARSGKISSIAIDLELCRLTVRELLGGTKPPKQMEQFLQAPAGDDAVEEYKKWHEALTKSFGARKFTKWELTAELLYNIV